MRRLIERIVYYNVAWPLAVAIMAVGGAGTWELHRHVEAHACHNMITEFPAITDHLITPTDPLYRTARLVAKAMGCNINNVTTGETRAVNLELNIEAAVQAARAEAGR